MTVDYVTGTDVNLAVRRCAGRAGHPVMLLVHGWGGDSETWYPLIKAADGAATFVAVDLRGHGRSSRARTAHTVEAMADDLDAVMMTVGVDAAVVVGHSMGGNVAVELGVRRPAWLRAIVAVDPAYDDPGWADAGRRAAAIRREGSRVPAARIAEAFAPGVAPELIERARRTLLGTDPGVLVEALLSTYLDARAFGHRLDTEAKLRALELPLLSIYPRADAAERARQFSVHRHTVAVIDGSGHFVPLEQPDVLWAVVAEWLPGLVTSAGTAGS